MRRRGRWPIDRRGTISVDRRGYRRIWLGKGHPYANSAGWQYLHRYLVMADTGERLRSDEHVHHQDERPDNNSPQNLLVVLAEYHGQHHASIVDLMGWRDEQGRFVAHDQPAGPHRTPRYAAVIGPAARRA